MSKKKLVCLALVLALAAGCSGKGGPKKLKLGHVLPPDHPVHQSMVFMAEKVKAKSEGKLVIEIFPGAQLGSERECLEQLQIGSLDMTKTSTSQAEGFVPELQSYSYPFLFDSEEAAWKVFNGEIGKELLSAGEKNGLKGLCYYDAGSRSFYMNGGPIEKPDDLKGKKIRVMRSNTFVNMIKALGGSATPISFGELYTALQQGVVDGAENNPPSVFTSRHYEVCKYYSLDRHAIVPDVLWISTHTWKKLSEDQKRWLTEGVAESVPHQLKLWKEFVDTCMEKMKEDGMKINNPDIEPFREKTRSMYDEVKGTDLGRLIDRIKAAQAAAAN
jgi:tripartite ATP-independent transporter DctP family solute receptor